MSRRLAHGKDYKGGQQMTHEARTVDIATMPQPRELYLAPVRRE